MNKHYLVLFLGFIIHCGFAQQWVDSIDAARQAYHKKNYADAERIYKSQYEKAKSKGGIDEELAQTKYRQRDYKGAIHFYQKKLKSVKNKTEKARVKHNLGNSYFEKGDYAKAINAYKEALRLNPSNDKTRYNLSEAIRQQQNQEEKNKPNNPNKQNGPKKNPSDSKQKNDPKSGNNNNKNSNKNGQSSQGKLPKKEVERKLDELARKEGETRRKMGSGKSKSNNSSNKDW